MGYRKKQKYTLVVSSSDTYALSLMRQTESGAGTVCAFCGRAYQVDSCTSNRKALATGSAQDRSPVSRTRNQRKCP